MKEKPALFFDRKVLIFALFLVPACFVPAQSPSPRTEAEIPAPANAVPPGRALSARSRLAGGIQLYSQRKWSEAVFELRRAQAEAPSKELRAEALFWISLSELSSGAYEEALLDMEALAETDPEGRRIGELAYHRGRVLYYLGRYDEAIVDLKEYADSFPEDGALVNPADISRKAAAFYWTGECLFSVGQFDKSADVFQLIVDEYSGSAKYEAAVFRLALISQKKVEAELLALLKWSHEESLRNMEDYRQRESAYDQAMNAYQKRLAEIETDTRLQDLEDSNVHYREQLALAEERLRFLENALKEAGAGTDKKSASLEKLNSLKNSARELEELMLTLDGDSPGGR